MKNILLILTTLLISSTIFAQAPNEMSYQTVIRNSSNALVTSQGVGIQISILQGSSTGSAVYVERHFPNTNANGLASFEIGTGNVMSGTFASINWGTGTYFIKTETDPNGGSNYTITGTSQLLSVPYALHSKTADALTGGGSVSNWTTSGTNISSSNTGNVGVGALPNSKLHVNGSTTVPALRAQIGGQTKLLVNTNGGVSVGANSVAPTDGLYVNGDVGIGIAAPTSKLHVNGGALIGNTYELPLGSPWNITNSQVILGGAHNVSFNGGTKVKLLISSYDNDGATIYPIFVEDENGNNDFWIRGRASASASPELFHGGTAYKPGGGSWTAWSDARLKNQVAPYKDGLSSILAINPVTFHYNEILGVSTTKEHVGVIAQELKEVAPYMVGTFKQDEAEYFDVNNSAMTYMLVNAVKEQQAQIETLNKQLEALTAKLNLLLEQK